MRLIGRAAATIMTVVAATGTVAQTASPAPGTGQIPAPQTGSPTPAPAAPSPTPAAPAAAGDGTMLLTVFFKHDQSKTLDEINEQLRQNHYYEKFPPPGIEVVSWYVVMGIGQIATFRFPPSRLREMNRIIEETAWGGYRTEFFPTYDYKAAAETQRQQMLAKPLILHGSRAP